MRYPYVLASRAGDDGRIVSDHEDGVVITCNGCGRKLDVHRHECEFLGCPGGDQWPAWSLSVGLCAADGTQLMLSGDLCLLCRGKLSFADSLRALVGSLPPEYADQLEQMFDPAGDAA